jgi:hypothetical protein
MSFLASPRYTILVGCAVAGLNLLIAQVDDEPIFVMQEELFVGEERQRIEIDDPGSTTFDAETVRALADSSGDPNELMEILPNVQFDDQRFRLDPDALADLSPAQVSISGGRPYEKNFTVDGLGTNSLFDSTNTNIGFDRVIGHPQTVFLDASLIESFTIYDSNIPAEYSGFLGGVVDAETRDPRDTFGYELSGSYTSDSLTRFKIDPDQEVSEFAIDPTAFTRWRGGISFDLPLNEDLSALVAYQQTGAEVVRAPLSSRYFRGSRPRDTFRENFLAKFLWRPTDLLAVRFQILATPYENQYWRTNISRQYGAGLASQLTATYDFENSTVTATLGWSENDTSREEDLIHYRYDVTESTDWVDPSGSASALRGGFGDFDQRSEDLVFSLKQSFTNLSWGSVSWGLEAKVVEATRGRPEESADYSESLNTEVFKELGLVVINDPDPTPGTSLADEQILTEWARYPAYLIDVSVFQLGAFAQWSESYEIFEDTNLIPRVGIRYDYNDFLKDHTVGPRLSLALELPWDVGVTAGWNRYYGASPLSYALREATPAISSMSERQALRLRQSLAVARAFSLLISRSPEKMIPALPS